MKGLAVAEEADQAHKDFLDENTEEFEHVMMWLQEQAHLSASNAHGGPPKLLFEILKERLVQEENKIKAQMSEKDPSHK